jgi:ankyrin repeat protein
MNGMSNKSMRPGKSTTTKTSLNPAKVCPSISRDPDLRKKIELDGNTSLHYAALKTDIIRIAELIIAGENTYTKNKYGKTPYDLVREKKEEHNIKLCDEYCICLAMLDNSNAQLSKSEQSLLYRLDDEISL